LCVEDHFEREWRERRERRERERVTDQDELAKEKATAQSTKEKELESVKLQERYLGMVKKKKRIRRLNDRKFVFDWDAGEDTSLDYNPIYKDKHQVRVGPLLMLIYCGLN